MIKCFKNTQDLNKVVVFLWVSFKLFIAFERIQLSFLFYFWTSLVAQTVKHLSIIMLVNNICIV